MRRRLSSAALTAALLVVAGSRTAAAQSTSGTDAGVFLLLPTGAQSVGMGQAFVAAEGGSESVWWNPAGLAGQTKHELAIHHSQTIAATGDVLAFVIPSKFRGTAAISVNILNPGEQQVTDDQGQPIGLVLPRDLVFAATYAKKFGGRFNAGLTYKVIQFRVDCSGQCSTVGTFVNSSTAADAGIQYRPSAASPLSLGLAVRSFGGKVRAGSSGPGDALPTRTDAGILYHVVALDRYLKDTQVNGAASIVATRGESGASFRVGTDIVYQNEVHFRAGYISDNRHNDSSASLGFGLQNGHLGFDIARSFGGLSSDQGQPPTYLSLRYLF
jgi:hypothetical protein